MAGSLPRRGALLPALLLGFFLTATAFSAEPEIRSLSIRGLQIAGTTTVVIDGDGFGTAPKLLLPFPAKVTLKTGATDKQATFEVTLGDDVTPGYHQLRVVNDNRVSFPTVVTVDRFKQTPLVPVIEQLPVAVHGTIAGSAIAETNFTGKAGEKIIIEVEAQRLGSKLRPIVHLYGPKKLQVAWAWGLPALQGDTRLEATLPDEGVYKITLHDAEYQAPALGFYRMRVGRWSFVDQVFPSVIGKATTNVELLGSETSRADVPSKRDSRWLPLAWPKQGTFSGPRPFVENSSGNEVIEAAATGKPQQLPTGNVSVSGRLAVPFEEDRYRVPVTPGAKVRFEIFAERLGSPIDVGLVIRNEMGADVARVEDGTASLDPVLEYTVPAKIDAVIVAVVDSQGRGGPRGIYRLTVDPVVAGGPGRNEFELFTPEKRISVAAEGRSVVPVWIERRGYTGAVELKLIGLPTGMKADGLTIPAGAEGTLVSITAGAAPITPVILSIQGKASDGREQEVTQKNHPMEKTQPWLAAELGLGGSSATGKEMVLEWKESKGVGDDIVVPGRNKTLSVKLKRNGPATPVRLTLLSSQQPVVVNNAVDPNRTMRLDKPLVEIPAAMAEAEVTILIPGDLPGDIYDFAILAESVAPNKKDVTATAVTPVRRLPVKLPVDLKLQSPSRIDVKLDPKVGASFEIVGTVVRPDGPPSEVAIAVTGFPASAKIAPLTLKATETAFRLKVTLPAGLPAGETTGIKLSGSPVPAPKLPANLKLRNRDIELVLNILPAK